MWSLSSVLSLVTLCSVCCCLVWAAPNCTRKLSFPIQSTGRNASGYLPEARATAVVGPEKKEKGEGLAAEERNSWSSSSHQMSKRSSEDDWQASLTEGDRGGLDTILINNLGISPSETEQLTELDIDKSSVGLSTSSRRKRRRRKRNSTRSPGKLWPGGIIPYMITNSLDSDTRDLINEAIKEFVQQTCLQFVPWQPSHVDYIVFTRGAVCKSSIGRKGGEQEITLTRLCGNFRGLILHEIAHAIGMFHEHTRPDRNSYVTIHFDNVLSAMTGQFDIQSSEEVTSFGVPYDYDSIMHYSHLAYSKNGRPTILPRMAGVYELGQKVRLSPRDIKEINLLYNCQNTDIHLQHEVSFSHMGHAHFTGDTFFIEDLTGQNCLSTPSTRNLDPRLIRYHHHESLYPVLLVQCNRSASSQLWHRSGHFLVHVDTLLCLGLVFEPGQAEPKVVLQTCKEGFFDQIWYCSSGNRIMDATNATCLSVIDQQMRRRRRRESPVLPSEYDHSSSSMIRRLKRSSTMSDEIRHNLGLARCPVASAWRFNDPNEDSTHDDFCSQDSSVPRRCYPANMQQAAQRTGKRVRCDSPRYFISGFFHTYNFENPTNRYNRNAGLISAVKCCTGDSDASSSSQGNLEECSLIKWWDDPWTNTVLISKGWVSCPRGTYLKGMLLSSVSSIQNHNIIESIECCKSLGGPMTYRHCYQDSTSEVLDTTVHGCRLEGHFITAVERRNCNSDRLNCEEVLTCCRA